MYGFVNRALQDLVIQGYGPDVWKEILKKANLDLGDSREFNERRIYDDQNTSDLLIVAEDVIGLSKNAILERFGDAFFEHCIGSGYDSMIRSLGGNLMDFFNSLDGLHEQLLLLYPGMRPPSFRAKRHNIDMKLELVYTSERSGLEYMVVGLVKTVASKLYGIQVNVELASMSSKDQSWAMFYVLPQHQDEMKYILPTDTTLERTMKELSIMTLSSRIGTAAFCRACPFHAVFDQRMVIYQAGISLCRVLPAVRVGKSKLTDIFESIRPPIKLTFDNILQYINKVYVIKTKSGLLDSASLSTVSEDDYGNLESPSMRFRGQMMYLPECNSIMFLASPSVVNLDGLNEKGLYMSDIPIHDATRDLILLSEQHNAEFKLSQRLEILTDKLQQTSRELENEQQLNDRLLYSILPASVANDLRLRKPVNANKYEIVTIMFSGIVDFTNYCNKIKEPMEIVEMLNEVYTEFDQLTDSNDDIYKVETVGDKYMAVSGLPTRCDKHALNIANLALDMIDISKGMKAKGIQLQVTIGIHSGEVVAGVVGQKKPRYCLFGNTVNLTSRTETTGLNHIKIGIHSGEVVAGVVGHKTPRYCLFGNTVNLTSRTETTGAPGQVNITEFTYRCLLEPECQDPSFVFERRGPVAMKGRQEPMVTYLLTRDPRHRSSSYIDNLENKGTFLRRGSVLTDQPTAQIIKQSPPVTRCPITNAACQARAKIVTDV